MDAVSLLGLGKYLPETILTNDDLSRIVDTDDEWITTRTGIRARHVLGKGEVNTDMGLRASLAAVGEAQLAPSDITHILYASCTPEDICPAAAFTLSRKLGVTGLFAMDINAACSGFLFGLVTARGLIAAEPSAKVLLVTAEALTMRLNWQDRSTCVLFGDGAAAVVLAGASAGKGIALVKDAAIASDGSLGPLLRIGSLPEKGAYAVGDPVGPEFFVRMEGREVFKHAVRNMAAICREVLERNNLTMDDIDLFVPHQANLRIIGAVGAKLGAREDQVFVNVDTCGNTSAASIPVALAEAREKKRLLPGMRVLVTTFGGGLSWSAGLLQF
jgi:3-oxoacyl-[acyl-carrier-protein] synthase-3